MLYSSSNQTFLGQKSRVKPSEEQTPRAVGQDASLISDGLPPFPGQQRAEAPISQVNVITNKNKDKITRIRSGLLQSDPKARILNMNQQVSFDGNLNKKKNKNDFYRFLLQ